MKRAFFSVIMLIIAASIYGQNIPDAAAMTQLANRIGLSEEETERVMNIYQQTESVVQEANLELNILKAQLARLLFYPDVDMREVEELLKGSYEWQLKRQLAQIRRQVGIRKILGEERWAQYSRLLKTVQQRRETQPPPAGR